MALWRVLDKNECSIKTSGSLRSPSSTRHKQTQRTKPSNRLKSKAAAKIRRHAQAFRVRRILAAALSCFLHALFFFCKDRDNSLFSSLYSVK